MKKRYVLGSAIMALLMLVSTQIVFINTVISDPQAHTGDADVGELWIDELDSSDAGLRFDNIGIAHVNASDDWVLWENGEGNFTADWSCDITSIDHPEYFVIFSLGIYNMDDGKKEIGNDTTSMTINADSLCGNSGSLNVPVEFSQEMIDKDENTIVCYLGAVVKINQTGDEAVNFSSVAEDRSVIGVTFNPTIAEHPFSRFTDKANREWPSMWSWIDGWETKFQSEEDMLNFQTYFNVGSDNDDIIQNESNDPWHVGNASADYRPNTYRIVPNFSQGDLTVEWSFFNESFIEGFSYMNWSVTECNQPSKNLQILFRYRFFTVINPIPACTAANFIWKYGGATEGFFGTNITADHYSQNQQGDVPLIGYLWISNGLPPSVRPGFFLLTNYKIDVVDNANNSGGTGIGIYYWEESCAYTNDSYDIEVDSSQAFGITNVEANIIEVLQSSSVGEFIYTFGGDSNDVNVEFVCEL